MSKTPSLPFDQDRACASARRHGWIVVRQKVSHIRLQTHTPTETLKLTVPAHRPVKRSTLAHILKQAKLPADDFLRLV